MNRKTILSTAIALMMIAGQPAFAQGNSDHGNRDHGNRNDRDNQEWKQQGRHDNRDFGRSHNEQRSRGRGAGPNHEYYRGDRLPAEYRHRNYVVDDWRGHRLSAPPRGYHWVQSGNDYILIAIATGVIAQLMLGQ
jgi:Ni/Co efflux regulator RcnB